MVKSLRVDLKMDDAVGVSNKSNELVDVSNESGGTSISSDSFSKHNSSDSPKPSTSSPPSSKSDFATTSSTWSPFTKPVVGKAGIDYEIVETPDDKVLSILNEKHSNDNAKKIIDSNNFYSLFITMSVMMKDPDDWKLKWARFEFDMGGPDVSVTSYAPDNKGIKTSIEKTGSRNFTLSLNGKVGVSVDGKESTTTKDTTSERTISVGPELSAEAKYDNTKGWKVTFDQNVSDLKGVSQKKTDGGQMLTWDMYKNEAIQAPGGNIGETTITYATCVVRVPKNSPPKMVTVSVSGDAKGGLLRRNGKIEFASMPSFPIVPAI